MKDEDKESPRDSAGRKVDDEVFRMEMEGVRPLKPADKVRLPKKNPLDPDEAARRRQRATGEDRAGHRAAGLERFAALLSSA